VVKESKTAKDRAAAAWQVAADDLGLGVVAPYQVMDPTSGESIDCVALVRGFGTAAGAVLMDMASDTAAHREAVSRLGFFVSLINVVAYSEYDRPSFRATLNDWGWFGAPDQTPAWYTGQAWS
jgi:hypothetical protein